MWRDKLWESRSRDPIFAGLRWRDINRLVRRGDMNRAIAELKALIEDPTSERIRGHLCLYLHICCTRQRAVEDAEKYLMRAFKEPYRPPLSILYRYLGSFLLDVGRRAEAKRALDNAFILQSTELNCHSKVRRGVYCIDPAVARIAAWVHLGIDYYIGDWLDEAEKCFRTALTKIRKREMLIETFVETTEGACPFAWYPFNSPRGIMDICNMYLGAIALRRGIPPSELGIDVESILTSARKYRNFCEGAVGIEELVIQFMQQSNDTQR